MPMYVFIHSYIQNIGDHNKGSQWSIINIFYTMIPQLSSLLPIGQSPDFYANLQTGFVGRFEEVKLLTLFVC